MDAERASYSHTQDESIAILLLGHCCQLSRTNCHQHYPPKLPRCHFRFNALFIFWQAEQINYCVFALRFTVARHPSQASSAGKEGATQSENSWQHRGRNQDFLAARPRQIFSHQPAFTTPQKPFQLYVRCRHWSTALAHTDNRIQSSYTSKWLSSSSSAAPLRATPAGSLPSLPPSRSKSLQ